MVVQPRSARAMSRRTIRKLLAAALLALAACAEQRAAPDADVGPSSAGARPNACEAELRAFVALTRLARQYGESWIVFEPAIDAMRERIFECVEESYPSPVRI